MSNELFNLTNLNEEHQKFLDIGLHIAWEKLDNYKDFETMKYMWEQLCNGTVKEFLLFHMKYTEPVFGPYNVRQCDWFAKYT